MARAPLHQLDIYVRLPTPAGWGPHEDVDINFIVCHGLTDTLVEGLWKDGEWGYLVPPSRRAALEGRC